MALTQLSNDICFETVPVVFRRRNSNCSILSPPQATPRLDASPELCDTIDTVAGHGV